MPLSFFLSYDFELDKCLALYFLKIFRVLRRKELTFSTNACVINGKKFDHYSNSGKKENLKDDYLFYAEKLLLNTSFYVEHRLVEKEQFIQVFNHYIEVINESTGK